ncbi:hypothetical protein C2845_PM05G16720 [Panicum miliaceum]|uniref:Uncharacterized protein n=1 Tax=Panicum miliaceum TaxID=4540 RepID=A0A3L6SY97_PANMI|nr:hypothetical protein C2845_PM05G16720 [Panicum miliaceum]
MDAADELHATAMSSTSSDSSAQRRPKKPNKREVAHLARHVPDRRDGRAAHLNFPHLARELPRPASASRADIQAAAAAGDGTTAKCEGDVVSADSSSSSSPAGTGLAGSGGEMNALVEVFDRPDDLVLDLIEGLRSLVIGVLDRSSGGGGRRVRRRRRGRFRPV